jgi:hypothetical protein
MLGSYIAGVHKIFTKLGPTSKLWLPDVRNAARLHSEGTQDSGVTPNNLLSWPMWRQGFIHPYYNDDVWPHTPVRKRTFRH